MQTSQREGIRLCTFPGTRIWIADGLSIHRCSSVEPRCCQCLQHGFCFVCLVDRETDDFGIEVDGDGGNVLESIERIFGSGLAPTAAEMHSFDAHFS